MVREKGQLGEGSCEKQERCVAEKGKIEANRTDLHGISGDKSHKGGPQKGGREMTRSKRRKAVGHSGGNESRCKNSK